MYNLFVNLYIEFPFQKITAFLAFMGGKVVPGAGTRRIYTHNKFKRHANPL